MCGLVCVVVWAMDPINQSINHFNVLIPGQDDLLDGYHSITQTKNSASYARPVLPLLKGLISGSLNLSLPYLCSAHSNYFRVWGARAHAHRCLGGYQRLHNHGAML